MAERTHRIGLRRLFALQLKDQVKYLEKNIPNLQQMGMQYMPLGSQEELRDQIIHTAIDIACLQSPLPNNAAAFNQLPVIRALLQRGASTTLKCENGMTARDHAIRHGHMEAARLCRERKP